MTELLRQSRAGDKEAFDHLLPLVHTQLESLASACLRSSRPDQTLRSTALVNEAYLKLVGASMNWEDRGHFFAVAARAMRQILVDHARSRKREKRGGAPSAARLTKPPWSRPSPPSTCSPSIRLFRSSSNGMRASAA